MAIKSPYNFVPTNNEIFTNPSDSYDLLQYCQDVPFKDAECGIIRGTIENISPLFIRNGHGQNTDDLYSSYFESNNDKIYFIPATSIKGMLRNILEILSFAKMKPFNNHTIESHKISDGVHQKNSDNFDLCEALFGVVNEDGNNNLKGRVSISNAIATTIIPDNSLINDSGVLASPEPSFFPLYLSHSSRDKKYSRYTNPSITIAGRKRYRVHQDSSVKKLPIQNNNDDVISTINAIPSGTKFDFCISLHNVRPYEIGAILSALYLHKTEGVWNNIGAAKPFGFGKIKCNNIRLSFFKENEDFYLSSFEEQMTYFTFDKLNLLWKNTPQIKSLMQIASEHSPDIVSFMSSEESKRLKDNFDTLNEAPHTVNSFLSDDKIREITEVISIKHKEAKELEIRSLISNNKLNEAQDSLIEYESLYGYTTISDQFHQEIDTKRKELIYNNQTTTTISSNLDERLNNVLPNGKFAVTTFKVCKQKIDQWSKNSNAINEKEIEVIHKTIIRLKANPDKKEKFLWDKFDSTIWTAIQQWVGRETAQMWFNEQITE